ncbi:MAG: flagellar basal body-associated FliL family protein [Phyllobacterium sp.]
MNNMSPKVSPTSIAAVVIALTLIAGLCGWFLGGYLGSSFGGPPAPAETAVQVDPDKGATGSVVALKPILTNVKLPQNVWIRLEAGLVAKPGEVISDNLASMINGDFMAFLRSVNLAQLRGAAGLEYLRMDLEERAKLRADGKVDRVLIWALVME